MEGMLGRLVIDNVRPRTLTGRYPAKAAVGDRVPVTAWVHREGHDLLAGRVWWRPRTPDGAWRHAPLTDDGNDEWSAWFEPTAVGMHEFAVEAWADHFATWAHDLRIRAEAGDDLELELEEGALLIERLAARLPPQAAVPPTPVADAGAPTPHERLAEAAATLRRTSCAEPVRVAAGLDPDVAAILRHVPDPFDRVLTEPQLLWVDRERARGSAWYELFPAPTAASRAQRKRLPAVADMGFDVRVPAAHPPHRHAPHRKGREQHPVARPRRPRQPVGHRCGGRRPHADRPRARHPRRLRRLRRRRRRPRPRGRARLRPAVLARPPLGDASTPSGSTTVPTAPSATPRTRRRSTRTSTRSTSGPSRARRDRRRAVGGVQGHPRPLDRPRRAHLPRRQPAHQAVGVLGVADPRGPAPSTPT